MSVNEYFEENSTLPDYEITQLTLANQQLTINIGIDVRYMM